MSGQYANYLFRLEYRRRKLREQADRLADDDDGGGGEGEFGGLLRDLFQRTGQDALGGGSALLDAGDGGLGRSTARQQGVGDGRQAAGPP